MQTPFAMRPALHKVQQFPQTAKRDPIHCHWGSWQGAIEEKGHHDDLQVRRHRVQGPTASELQRVAFAPAFDDRSQCHDCCTQARHQDACPPRSSKMKCCRKCIKYIHVYVLTLILSHVLTRMCLWKSGSTMHRRPPQPLGLTGQCN